MPYFNGRGVCRVSKARKTWKNSLQWYQLTDEERYEAAGIRVLQHEKLFKHHKTRDENIWLIQMLYEELKKSGIKLMIYISPMTKEYQNGMSELYRDKVKEILTIVQDNCDACIDLNECVRLFGNEDFVDSDHLSDAGANKMKTLIEKFLIK